MGPWGLPRPGPCVSYSLLAPGRAGESVTWSWGQWGVGDFAFPEAKSSSPAFSGQERIQLLDKGEGP